MLKIIKGGEIFAPAYCGEKDILLGGGQICQIEDKINPGDDLSYEIIDASANYILPGFIDNHVHITGGGGEGGFKTRTPAISLSDITRGGVTTVIGCLGTDGTTRSMADLLGRARGLEEEGITAYIYTGSYQYPVRTLTGDIQDDIVLIDKIIGVGELALADHRSSQPTLKELSKAASAARVGGILSGKAGIVNIHMGDGERNLEILEEIADKTEIPLQQFLPTHLNRNSDIFKNAIEYGNKGGLIDLTTSTTSRFIKEGERKCSHALKILLDEGVALENITFSSDGQGSLPDFDEDGNFKGLQVGRVTSLYREVRDAVLKETLPLEKAVSVITSNPARSLELNKKGRVKAGYDADLVLVKKDDLRIDTVIARGKKMLAGGEVVEKGTFE
ncbi:MAG: beta-aspartyl-peptidase [Halanaerobiales bacterium]